MVHDAIKGLVQYGLDKGLISEVDAVYARNQILDVMGMDEYEEPRGTVESGNLEAILKELLDCAAVTGVLKEDSVVYRDLLDTKLMNCLMPRPNEVVRSSGNDMRNLLRRPRTGIMASARIPIISAGTVLQGI